MAFKEKLPLIVGIGLPLLLIFYVGITAYLPSLFVKPKYNFIYATDTSDYNLSIVDGKVVMEQRYFNVNRPRQPTLWLYDVARDKSTQISLEKAQTYTLDPSNKSPDGFTVGRGETGGYSVFPFFFGGYDRGTYLMGKGLNRRISEREDYYNFKFLGWVVNE